MSTIKVQVYKYGEKSYTVCGYSRVPSLQEQVHVGGGPYRVVSVLHYVLTEVPHHDNAVAAIWVRAT